MARFMLAWEFGAGLGHAGRFKPLAQTLLQRGHHVDLALREMVHTWPLLKDLKLRVLQAPAWTHQTVGLPSPQVSLAEIVLGLGYLKAESLEALVAGWRNLIELTEADVLVCDYAPTAYLAARSLGIPAAAIGIGFYLPPDVEPVPPFRTWEPIQAGRVEYHDQLALGVVNQVLDRFQAPPLPRLADLFRADLPLLCTWPELDHYNRGALPSGQRYHGPNFLPSVGLASEWPACDGPRVFAYLRAVHPDHLAVLQALVDVGCCVQCYMPELSGGRPVPLVSERIHYAKEPVHLAQALSACQLLVCHAGEGAVAQSLLAGVPLLLLPMQAEQFLMAVRLEEIGAAINVASRPRPNDFKHLLSTLLNEPRHRQAAQGLATRHARFNHGSQIQELVAAFESLL